MCVVEVEGMPNLVPSCAFPVRDGLRVLTHSRKVVEARRTIVELLLADHPDDCLYCARSGNCQLQSLADELGVRRRFRGARSECRIDVSSRSIVREPAKCILCGKCVRVCEEIQHVGAIDFAGRGSRATVGTAFNEGLNVSSCINCGQCVVVCPTGALTEKRLHPRRQRSLGRPQLFVVAQHAPSVSVSLGEEFGLPPGMDVAGSMTAALALHRLRPRLRHRLLRRPDDHGRGLGADSPHPDRRQAADAHQLLARLDPLRRDVPPRLSSTICPPARAPSR